MFTIDSVALRPLEIEDIDTLYSWSTDMALEMLAGWGRPVARSAFRQRHEQRILEPRDDLETFGVVVQNQLVGYVQLALIERLERRAAICVLLGDSAIRGQGIGAVAIRILLDYAFTVVALERIFAECYGFNTRAHRLFTKVGFQQEGILRQHELHNGTRQDMHIFGILKAEF